MRTFPTKPEALKAVLIRLGKQINTSCIQAQIKFGRNRRSWNLISGIYSILEQGLSLISVILLTSRVGSLRCLREV